MPLLYTHYSFVPPTRTFHATVIIHNKRLRVVISSRSITKALNKQFNEGLEGGAGISAIS